MKKQLYIDLTRLNPVYTGGIRDTAIWIKP